MKKFGGSLGQIVTEIIAMNPSKFAIQVFTCAEFVRETSIFFIGILKGKINKGV
jgi:hypothetical protein